MSPVTEDATRTASTHIMVSVQRHVRYVKTEPTQIDMHQSHSHRYASVLMNALVFILLIEILRSSPLLST